MITESAAQFGARVLGNYSSLRKSGNRSDVLEHSLTASAQITSGHPIAASLSIGQKVQGDIVSVFLDIGSFTRRTRLMDPLDATDLAHSVLTGFTGVVQQFGGHILGLRGDGVLAAFGPTDPTMAVLVAGVATGVALEGVQQVINPELVRRRIDPITARAGMDYGTAVFVRTGSAQASEVNVIGFNTNFAAKCEKHASAWEVVVGEDFAGMANLADKMTPHPCSPKTYTENGVDQYYRFFKYNWRYLLQFADSVAGEINGQALEQISL